MIDFNVVAGPDDPLFMDRCDLPHFGTHSMAWFFYFVPHLVEDPELRRDLDEDGIATCHAAIHPKLQITTTLMLNAGKSALFLKHFFL